MLFGTGFGNMARADAVIAISDPSRLPIKRLINEAEERDQLIDHTAGKARRAALTLTGGWVVLSAISPKQLARRIDDALKGGGEDVGGHVASPSPMEA